MRIAAVFLAIAVLALATRWGAERMRFGSPITPGPALEQILLPDEESYLTQARSALPDQLTFVPELNRELQAEFATRPPMVPWLVQVGGGLVGYLRWQHAIAAAGILALAFWRPSADDPHRAAAAIAAALLALDPLLVGLSAMVLSEAIYVALVTVALVVISRSDFKWTHAIVLAILGAALAYTRPMGWVVLAGLLLWRVLLPEPHRRATLAKAAVVLAVAVASPLPWMVRNANLPGGALAMTSNAGKTAFDSLGPQATGRSEQAGFMALASHAGVPTVGAESEWAIDRYFRTRTWEHLAADPLHAVQLVPAKIAALWRPFPFAQGYNQGLTFWAVGLWSCGLYACACMGIYHLRRSMPRLVLLLLTPAVVITLIHAIAVGSLRYRVPAIPGLTLLAGYGLAWMLSLIRKRS